MTISIKNLNLNKYHKKKYKVLPSIETIHRIVNINNWNINDIIIESNTYPSKYKKIRNIYLLLNNELIINNEHINNDSNINDGYFASSEYTSGDSSMFSDSDLDYNPSFLSNFVSNDTSSYSYSYDEDSYDEDSSIFTESDN